MTLIVGIRCKNGVVVATDSAATVNDAVVQPTNKLSIIKNQLILGVSGSGGMAGLIEHCIDENFPKLVTNSDPRKFCKALRDGRKLDDALRLAYGKAMESLEALEAGWREKLAERGRNAAK